MPRPTSPETRRILIERAAGLLARRQPVTLRALVEGTGVSTMAVYTYFDGMPGLWGAVRQEGFVRLGDRLRSITLREDPVEHLSALGIAYLRSAFESPDLYRAMFDAAAELPDPSVSAAGFAPLVAAATRAREAGRFDPDQDSADVALKYWADGHGLTSLGVTGVLPTTEVERLAPSMQVAQFVAAGDTADRARRSVASAWADRS